jgi:hypothetical protein
VDSAQHEESRISTVWGIITDDCEPK